MPSPVITRTDYLVINSVPLATPAWEIVDLSELWDATGVKGADIDIPHAHGSLAMPRRRAMTVYSLGINIYGQRDQENTVYPNPWNGLYTNIAYLRGNVTAPVSTGNGTVAATLHLPDGSSTLTANVTPLGGLRVKAEAHTMARAVLTFSIADGQFA